MANSVTDFVKTYFVIAAILLVFALVIAVIAHSSFLYITMLVYLWGGFAYVLASLLAWTGFANLYRYSPTLFIGSRSYRRQVVRGDLWKEGRDDESLVLGIAFGAALMALGAALWDPVFIFFDGLAVALVALLLRVRRSRISSRS